MEAFIVDANMDTLEMEFSAQVYILQPVTQFLNLLWIND